MTIVKGLPGNQSKMAVSLPEDAIFLLCDERVRLAPRPCVKPLSP